MLVGIYAPQPQAGKGTAAKVFYANGWRRLSIATPVKASMLVVLNALGVQQPKRYLWGDLKDTPIPALGITGGALLSKYAVFMRGLYGDIWLDPIRRAYNPQYNYVIDDLRFPNEYDWIENEGGRMIKIVRGATYTHDRVAEGLLETYYFEHIFYNNGSITELTNAVQAWLDTL